MVRPTSTRRLSVEEQKQAGESVREARRRRHSLSEDSLFQHDDGTGPLPTIYSREESVVISRDPSGQKHRVHTICVTNQDSHGRIVWDTTKEVYDPDEPDKAPLVSRDIDKAFIKPLGQVAELA